MMKNYENDDADALFATMGTTKPQEISQLSKKVCSLSESASTTTFNEEETRQRVSPVRRNGGSVRLVHRRDQIESGLLRNQTRRRDADKNSSRRSRSLANQTDMEQLDLSWVGTHLRGEEQISPLQG
ncbi:hypothetical protein HN51_028300 [Arachis hypogaea]